MDDVDLVLLDPEGGWLEVVTASLSCLREVSGDGAPSKAWMYFNSAWSLSLSTLSRLGWISSSTGSSEAVSTSSKILSSLMAWRDRSLIRRTFSM